MLFTRILLNIIPVLRLDGYWVLSDSIEEPNLRQRAAAYLISILPIIRKRKRLNFMTKPQLRPLYLVFSVSSLATACLAIYASTAAVTSFLTQWPLMLRYTLVIVIVSVVLLSLFNFGKRILNEFFLDIRIK